MKANTKFGVAGNSNSFFCMGFRSLLEVPKYLKEFGLDAYEYQCGHGVKLSTDKAEKFKKSAKEAGIIVSVHSPYYISISSAEEEKREKSVQYIVQTVNLAEKIGADRIVVHSGSAGKIPRKEALELAKKTLKTTAAAVKANKTEKINIYLETMGKINQLGTVSEVLELCLVDELFVPCLDFGHINSREHGMLKSEKEFSALFDEVENKLGRERTQKIHIHFSKIEYTSGGEKRHLTFSDKIYGPNFEDMLNVLVKKQYTPIIICESSGTQAEDARTMKEYYKEIVEKYEMQTDRKAERSD